MARRRSRLHKRTMDALARLRRRIEGWSARVGDQPVTPRLSRPELGRRLEGYDFSRPRPLEELVDDVADLLERGNLHATHPRYFGLFVPGVRPAGVIADALAALYNPQVGGWWHSPAAAEIEALTLGYLARRVGYTSADAGAWFTGGGSEANLTGVLCALARAFPRALEHGLAGAGARPVFYASDQAHDSFVKVARATGL